MLTSETQNFELRNPNFGQKFTVFDKKTNLTDDELKNPEF